MTTLTSTTEAETALADMRRERDAAEAALLWLFDHAMAVDGRMTVTHSDAVAAARSRVKPDGEEKK